ncbi:MAG TPA: NAD(P)-dependent oxidoreductase [Ktedonobacteraceae bacterium]|nr:NAD(P)-dependent oxidoreductase [Ktedonobacteraceae bacterium]
MTMQEQSKPTIGFIGMGHMGSHMVPRLIAAGYQLTLYDRTREKAQAIAGTTATVAGTPEEAAAKSDVIISIVTNDDALEEVMLGPNGVLAGTHAGSVIIDMSTVSPRTSRHLFQVAGAKGVAMIDAAVSGSVPQVDQGSLVIFVGGEHETYQRCKPLLDILGQSSFYMGPSGMGTTMKLVVNTLLGLGMQALAEAIALGEKAGLEKELLLDVLGQTTVLTPGQKSKLENVRREEYPTNFALSLQHKDLRLIMNEADEISVSMPATAVALQMYTAALAKGMDADFSIMIKFMEQLAGVSIDEHPSNH